MRKNVPGNAAVIRKGFAPAAGPPLREWAMQELCREAWLRTWRDLEGIMASGARLSLNLRGVVVSEMRILRNLRGIRCLGDANIV